MERLHYTTDSLRAALSEFERDYGMTSAAFYSAYLAKEPLEISGYHRVVWSGLYEEYLRLTGASHDELAARAQQALVEA